jgi:nitroreductase
MPTQATRRAFLRLVGGTTLLAAGAAASTGCSSRVPDEAIAAWRGPEGQADLRLWVLAHAILAPHSHNLQSWLVELRTPGEILLRVDLDRLLPQTDPLSRQIVLSQGTFLELLDLAARERGHRAQIELFPQGAFGPERLDSRPVARIRLVPEPGIARDPLFAQILRRHTNRNAYDPARAVPASAWQALVDAGGPAVRFGHVDAQDAAALAQHRRIANAAWRIELTTPRTIFESIQVLRVGASEVARHRDGITLMDPMVVALARLGLFDRSQPPAPDSASTRAQLDDFEKKIASTAAFLWLNTAGNDRVTQIQAGRAYARVQLAATAQGLAMQPISQALQEYREVATPYAEIHRLCGATAPGQTVQMWARVGYAAAVQPAPRRGLEAHLVRT